MASTPDIGISSADSNVSRQHFTSTHARLQCEDQSPQLQGRAQLSGAIQVASESNGIRFLNLSRWETNHP